MKPYVYNFDNSTFHDLSEIFLGLRRNVPAGVSQIVP